MPEKDYTFVPNLLQEVAPPDTGMTTVCYIKTSDSTSPYLVLPQCELKTHSVPIPALIYVVEGEGEFDLGSETIPLKSCSFIRMEALLPHAVRAKSPFRMLLVHVKDRAIQK